MSSSGAVAVAGLGITVPVLSTRWGTLCPGVTTITPAQGFLNLTPIRFARSATIDRVAVEVTVIGDVGSVVAPAWYGDNGGVPGSPIIALGTVPGDVVQVNTITTSFPVTVGLTYWVGGVSQLCPTIQPTLRGATNSVVAVGIAAAVGVIPNTVNGVRQNGVVGALPDPFVYSDFAFQIPRLAWRFV